MRDQSEIRAPEAVMSPLPTIANFTPPVEPDLQQALACCHAARPMLHFRSSRRAEGRPHADQSPLRARRHVPAETPDFLRYCYTESRAAFVLPGVVRPGGTGKADVLALPALCADFDRGDPAASLAAVEALIGPATVIAESGGVTECGPKLHAYWRLAENASAEAIDEACRVREEIAKRFGADPAFKQPAQVIRIPGSVHFKNGAKLVQLRTVADGREFSFRPLRELRCANGARGKLL